nr:SHOCT domain-containing protein [Candidatus Gracilibacteria bacterium]
MKKIIALVLGIIAFFILNLSTSAYYYGGYGMMGEEGLGYFGMGFGFIIFIIFLSFVVYFAIMMSKNLNHDSCKAKSFDTPLEILKKRLVKGEIDEKEYDKLKKKLEEKD